MADSLLTDITESTAAQVHDMCQGPCMVEKDSDELYFFYVTTNRTLAWRKSTDGGATWGAANTIRQTVQNNGMWNFSIWYDKWTPGDQGTKIHIIYKLARLSFTPPLVDGLAYRNLDTATDTLSAAAVAVGTQSLGWFSQEGFGTSLAIAKASDGTLMVGLFDYAGVADDRWYYSTTGGATWTTAAGPGWSFAADVRRMRIIADPFSANQVLVFVFHQADVSTSGRIFVRQWQTNGSWGAGSTPTGNVIGLGDATTVDYMNFDVGYRLHGTTPYLFLAVFTQRHTDPTSNLFFYRGTSLGTLSLLSVPRSQDATNKQIPHLYVDENSGFIYVSWVEADSAWASDRDIKIRRSLDAGATWTDFALGGMPDPKNYNDDANNVIEDIRSPWRLRRGSAFPNPGYMVLSWYDNNANQYRIGTTNRELLGQYKTRAAAYGGHDGNIVACPTGLNHLPGVDNPPLDWRRYGGRDPRVPLAGFTQVRYTETSGSHAVGQIVEGATSGTQGTIAGFITDAKILILVGVRIGRRARRGTFSPSETLVNQTTGGDFTIGDDYGSDAVSYADAASFAESI